MFKKAIKEAFEWSFKWYLGSFSTAIATFFFFEKYLEFTRARSIKYGIALAISTFILRALYQYVIRIDELEKLVNQKDNQLELLTSKKEKKKLLTANYFYGDAIIILKDIFAKIHSIRKDDKITNDELTESLVLLCNKLKELFEKRFNHNYSVCIKVLGPEVNLDAINPETQVSTLIRDFKSYKSRSQPSVVRHNIFSNTCYLEIFYNLSNIGKSHYLNNSLISDNNYRNTSFQIYGELPEECDSVEERTKHWKLPYKSELVVPITPLEMDGSKRIYNFLGYLCIDCDEEDAFHSKYDTQMIKGVADGIFDIIKLKNNLNQN